MDTYPLQEEMPCAPSDIFVYRYKVAGLGRAEWEEAAARLLTFSQEAGRWVGATQAAISAQIDKSYTEYIHYAGEIAARQSWLGDMRWRTVLCWLTLGLWSFTTPPPEVPEPDHDAQPRSFITMSGYGPDFVYTGLHELRDQGLLRQDRIGADAVYYPTAALVSKILAIQGKA